MGNEMIYLIGTFWVAGGQLVVYTGVMFPHMKAN